MARVLVTGSCGQIGTELVGELVNRYGKENIVATDIKKPPQKFKELDINFHFLDVLDENKLRSLITEYDIDVIIHNASILSAMGERNPQLAYHVNIEGFHTVLNAAHKQGVQKVFAPSSIAAFGPSTPKDNTPNEVITRPTTIYGISKVFVELYGEYYFNKFGLDFRSLRYPGIISAETLPGGGTTDYAVEIFYKALENKQYTCFLKEDAMLPMMYMPDCIKSTIQLIEADSDKLRYRTYNVTAMSFTPQELAEEIKKHIPEFEIEYKPDFRQQIAESWPRSVDDSAAREDWSWTPDFDLERMTKDMLEKLSKKLHIDY